MRKIYLIAITLLLVAGFSTDILLIKALAGMSLLIALLRSLVIHPYNQYIHSLSDCVRPSKFFVALILGLVSFNSTSAQITLVTGSPQSNTTTSTTLTITRPSGLAVNDVMIANIVQSDNDGNTLNDAALAGWTIIDGRDVGSTGNDHWRGTLLYKVAIAADVSAANFSFTVDADANEGSNGAIIAFRGVDVTGGFNATGTANSGPFDVDPGSYNNTNANSVTALTTTTTTANAAVVMFGAIGDNVNHSAWQTATGPLALTEIYDLPFNATLDNGLGAAWATKAVAGATGNGTATLSGTSRNGGILVALRACAPIISGTLNVCIGASTQLTGSGTAAATNPWVSATTSVATVNSTGLVTGVAAGTSVITYTTNGGCTKTATVTVNSLPTVVINTPAAVCSPGTVNLTAAAITTGSTAGLSYTYWTNPGATISYGTPATAVAGTYYIKGTNGNGCFDIKPVTVTVNTAATSNANSDQTVCSTSPAVTLAGVIGGSATSGTWSGGAGGFNPNATTLNAVYTPSGAEITAGTVTLTLTTDDPAGVCNAVADQMVITINTAASADAGIDQTICGGSTVSLAGTRSGAGVTSSTWTSSGTGGFGNASLLSTVYTPSAADVLAGTVTLTLTTNDPAGPCGAFADQMIVTISPAATVNANADQTVCSSSPAVTLAGSIGGSATSGTWSGGTGTFNPDNITLNAIYTPSAAEIAAGTVTLTLTTDDPAGICGAVADQMVITINTAASATAGADQTICFYSTVSVSGTRSGTGVTGSTWTSSGTGSFANAALPSTTYTPSAADKAAGSVTLTLTTNDPAGPCGAATSSLLVTIEADIAVNAGPDQTDNATCGLTSVTLSANTPSAGTGEWSIISGAGGSFGDESDPITGFDGVAGETYVLRWTITNGSCIFSDDVVVTFNIGATVADAGPDQTGASTCGLTTVTLAGNTALFGTGSWSVVSGTGGSFGSIGSPTSTFTGVAGNAYTLQWSIVSPCNTTTDQVDIFFNQNPTIANAGPDQTGASTCNLTTVTLAANSPSVGVGQWTIQSGAGGSFGNDASPTSTFSGVAGATYTLRWTITNAPCVASTDDVVITFNQLPTVADAGPDQTDAATCGLTSVSLAANTPVIGTGAWSIVSGTGGNVVTPSSATSTFTGTAGTTYTLRWTISNSPCTASFDEVTIRFNQVPSVTNANTKAICNNTSTNIGLTSSVPSSFAWTIGTITGGITGASDASGGTINQTLVNPSNASAGTVQYIVTPTSTTGSCIGSPYTITVTVNPTPVVTNASTAAICSGTGTGITLAASIGSNFAWTLGTNTGAITGATASSGGTINQTLSNPNNAVAGSIVYNVTPTSTAPNGSCPGAAYPITVTVNPKPAVTNSLSASTCSGTSPNITLAATAASTFAWTLGTNTGAITGATASSGSAINQVLTNPNNASAGSIVYSVTPTSSPEGCVGNATNITVTVNPKPVVSTANTKTICSGSSTNITLAATAASNFSWTIGTITGGITGASDASGGTINQILTNPSNNTAGSVQYLVTPTSTAGGCVGNSYTITVTVNPAPAITTTNTKTICSGAGTAITLAASITSNYAWTLGTNTGGITGGSATSGASISQTLTNPNNATAGSLVYNVVPTAQVTGCVGAAYPITVTVNPKPAVTNSLSASTCSGTSPNITLAASAASTFAWTLGTNTGAITGATASSGSAINQVLTNPNNASAGSIVYSVTPTSSPEGCVGNATNITVTVNPKPAVSNPATKTICSGTGANITLAASAASNYSWTVGTITGGITGANAGSGPSITEILNNPSNSTAGTVQYIITPTSTAGGCVGNTFTITVTVNATPTVSVAANYCVGGAQVQLTATPAPGLVSDYTYLWNDESGSTSNIVNVDLAGTYIVTATRTSTGCPGSGFINVAQELVVNGTFAAGNTGFTTGYTNNQAFYNQFAPIPANTGLYPEGRYAVNSNAYYSSPTSTNGYHPNFYGKDHTNPTGNGNFMMVNGSGSSLNVWQQTVNGIQPNTTYYFSAFARSLNNVAPFAQLQFAVDGVPVGTTAVLASGPATNAGPFVWERFYGSWTSGPSTTSAVLTIIDLQTATGGNDFGLDDISFGTLSPVPFVAAPLGNGGNPLCAGGTLNLTSNVTGLAPFTYSWTGPNGFTSAAANPSIANAGVVNSGTYFLTVTDGYGCPKTVSTSVTVNPVLANNTLTADQTVCNGQTPAALTGSTPTGGNGTYTYLWESSTTSAVAGFTTAAGTTNGKNYTFPAAMTQTTWYRRTVTSGGCTDISGVPVKITVNPVIATNTISTSQTICSGSTPTAFSGTLPTGGNNSYTYLWESSVNGGTTWSNAAGTNNTQNYTPGSLTQATLYRRTVYSGPCTDVSATILISINPLPVVTAAASVSPICNGGSSNLSSTPSAGSATLLSENFNTTNTWTKTNNSTGGTSGNAVWSLRANNYFYNPTTFRSNDNSQFYLSNSDAQGGGTTATILQTPVMNTTGYTTLSLDFYHYYRFNGGSETAKVEVSTDGSTWTNVATYTSTQGGPTAFVHPVINLNAYINNATFYVRFKYDATNDWYWGIDNVTLSGTPVTYTYSWTSSPSGFTSTAQNPTVSPTVTTAYTVTVTSSLTCVASSSPVTVTVNPVINGNTITANQTICSGSTPAQLDGAAPGGGNGTYTYNWESSINSGTTWTNAAGTRNGQNYVPGSLTQTTWYRRTVTSGPCTDISSTVIITVNNVIANNTITATQTICSGGTPAGLTGSTPTGGNGTYTYLWESSINSGTTWANAAGTNNTQNYTPGSLTQTTLYRRTVNSGPCTNTSTSIQITVNPVIAGNTITAAQAICTNTTPTALAGALPTGGNGTYTYNWESSINGGTTWGNAAGTRNGQNYTPGSLTQTTLYRRTVTSGPCTDVSASVQITVSPVIANNNIELTSLCQTSPTSAQVVITPATPALSGGNGTYTYIWQFSSPGNSSYVTIPGETGPSLTISQTANNGFYVRIVSSGGCSLTSGNVHVNINNVLSAGSFTVTGGGSYCAGGTGVAVGLSGSVASQSEYFVTYRLLKDGVYTGISLTGTGAALNFGNQTLAGTYTVEAIVTATAGTSCTAIIIPGNVLVAVNPLPADLTPTAAAAQVCIASSTTIDIAGSETGINYQLRIGTTDIGAAVAGNGGAINLPTGILNSTTTFNVLATNATTSCIRILTTTVTVTVNPVLAGNTISSSQVICAGSTPNALSGSVPSGGNGTYTYLWESSTTSAVAGFSAAGGTNNTQNYTPGIVSQNTWFRRTAGSGGCSDISTAIEVSTLVSGTWLGINTDWHDAQNWCGGVPTPATNVIIPSGLTNYPDLNTGIGTTNDITIFPNASVQVNNAVLKVTGTINNSGMLDVTSGTLELDGTAAQNIAGSMFASRSIKNLTNSNSSAPGVIVSNTVGDTLKITGELGFGYADANLSTGDNVVLVSNNAGTARVGQLQQNPDGSARASINGKVIVERYYPSKRAWRLVTAPVKAATAQTINEAWQEGAAPSVTSVSNGNPHPPYGIHITGPYNVPTPVYSNAVITGNGFDQSPQNNSSMKYYTGTSNTFDPVPNTFSMKVTDKQGWLLFVRGNRAYNIGATTNYTTATAATLRTKGVLNTGKVSIPADTGFQVIGNPYPSTIKFDDAMFTNNAGVMRSQSYQLWDPLRGSAKNTPTNVGGWVPVLYLGSNTYISTYDPSTNVPGLESSHPFDTDGKIQSGAAFLVDNKATATGDFVINESCKISGSNNYLYRPMEPQSIAMFRANLYFMEADDKPAYWADGAVNVFGDQYSNTVDWSEDVRRIASTGENLSIRKENKLVAIETRKPLVETDTIFYDLTRVRLGNYRFDFIATDMARPDMVGFVEDSYTGNRTPLNLDGVTSVPFSITNTVGTWKADRFRVVFMSMGAGPLPVTYASVKAWQQNKDIAVEWKVENELSIKEYEVEKSTDGRNFSKVNTTAAKGNNNSSVVYNWLDVNAAPGVNYYRIRSIDNNASAKYSQVVKVNIGKPGAGIAVYPNPVKDGVIGLQLSNMTKGKYQARLINTIGQVMLVRDIYYNGGNVNETINAGSLIAQGVYQLEVTGPDQVTTIIKIMSE